MQKFALFDFDDTIAHGDSINQLLKYTFQKHPLSSYHYIKVGILGILYVLHIVSKETLKQSILFPLDYFNNQELETFYKERVIPTYYPHMVEEMKKRKEEGCIVLLVTASAEAYMRYTDLPIDYLMGTQTEKKNGNYTSKMIGKNCKGKNKVDRINDYLNQHHYSIDYENSYGYSDSNSDIPMLSLVKNQYRVDKKDGHLSIFK